MITIKIIIPSIAITFYAKVIFLILTFQIFYKIFLKFLRGYILVVPISNPPEVLLTQNGPALVSITFFVICGKFIHSFFNLLNFFNLW